MQKIIENFFVTLKYLFKVMALSRFKKFPKFELRHKEVVILGNGPSLNLLLDENTNFLENKLKICVNYFAQSSYYETVKPEIYVLIDPGFWRADAPQTLKEQRESLYSKIINVTNWQLVVYMPFEAKNYKSAFAQLLDHKNIRIFYFNNVGVEGFSAFRYFCFDSSLGLPRPGNVLVACIFISIKLGLEKIYLAGADHDWIKHIVVGQDNKLYMVHNHFYEDTKDQKIVAKRWGGEYISLYKMLENFIVPLKSYFTLEAYSKRQNVKIYNITPNSFIDAFERLNINNQKN